MESIELLNKIEKIAELGTYFTDLTNGTWTGSDNFISIFGLPKKEKYTVEEFQALVHPDDFNEVMDYFGKCLAEKKDFNYEYRCVKPNGEVIYVNSRSEVIYSSDGTPIKIVGLKQDITQRKKYELRLFELNELNKKKNIVLSNVAHDLRSPLATIENVIDILSDKVSQDQLKWIDLQTNACNLSKSIIGDLIEIAKLENTSLELELDKVDLNKIIKQSINFNLESAKRKNIEFKMILADNPMVLINSEKFIRVVDNLLSNAIKFSSENKVIEVVTQVDNELIRLKVIDHGIGIPKSLIPLIFDRFSITTQRPGTQGERSTGLGLSIVKQIVELHDGAIKVESVENEGTTVIIELRKVID